MNRRGFDMIYLDAAKYARVHEGGQRGQRQGAEVVSGWRSEGVVWCGMAICGVLFRRA